MTHPDDAGEPGHERRPGPALAGALALAWFSGVAALAHQLLWTRRLVDVLGASADTFSTVIGAFFIGLACGAWLAARGGPTRDGWRRVALAELAVAVFALPMLFSAALVDRAADWAALGGWAKVLVPLLLITPPATAMGLVIPLMVRSLPVEGGFGSRHAVWLYTVNTFGGVAGIGLVVFEALPRFGLTGASLGAIGLNVAVGLGAFALSARRPRARQSRPCTAQEETRVRPELAARGIQLTPVTRVFAFVSGFLVLALEVVLQHQLAQVTINSLFSSATVLGMVLIALAIAAALVPGLVRWAGSVDRVLPWAFAAAALLCAAQPFALTAGSAGVKILPYELAPWPYLAEVLKLGALGLGPMLLAAGLVFPLLLRSADLRDGRQVGLLFAWNGLGGWLGAEFSQTLLAPTCGLWGSMVAIALGYFALAVGACVHGRSSVGVLRTSSGLQHPDALVLPVVASAPVGATGFRWLWFGQVVLLGVLIAIGFGVRRLPQADLKPGERLAAVAVGREGVVATIDRGDDDWRMLFNNSYTLGGSKAQFNQERQALCPMLLHGQPKSVATLGVATGSSVAGAALHPGVERIDAIELSPVVLRFAREFFGPYNRDVFGDARVTFHAEDARWVIAARPGAYDVVAGDLFLPWRTGEGRLFTLEHFRNVRRSLKPGGVFCQWLPLFQLTAPQFESISRTFREVFPEAFLLRGDFSSELPILGLVGGLDLAEVDWGRIEMQCERLRADGKVLDPLVRHAEGVAMMVLGRLPEPPAGPLNTLANGWLEWDAGRNILGLRTPWFIGVPLAEYLRGVHRSGQALVPTRFHAAHEAGQFMLTLEIAAKLSLPALENLKAQAHERLPAALRQDRQADWKQWPMRLKPVPPAAPDR